MSGKAESGGRHYKEKGELIELAKSLGLAAFFRERNELLIDWDDLAYDQTEAFKKQERVTQLFLDNDVIITGILPTRSKSGRTHLYVKLAEALPPLTAVAYQAVYGSDPIREAILLASLSKKLYEEYICLFETQDQAERITLWRKTVNRLNGDAHLPRTPKELEERLVDIALNPTGQSPGFFRKRKLTAEEYLKLTGGNPPDRLRGLTFDRIYIDECVDVLSYGTPIVDDEKAPF